MLSFSPGLESLLWTFAPAFTHPTFPNMRVLFVGAVMSPLLRVEVHLIPARLRDFLLQRLAQAA